MAECALGMGQRRSTDMNALMMDVQTNLSKEECARSTGQSDTSASYAAMKDAQI
jgi:hypothetical protein